MACRACQSEIVQQLIDDVKEKHGAEVVENYINTLNEDGATAMHYICNVPTDEVEYPDADKEIVRTLLQNGADVSVQTKQAMETCFHYLAKTGNNDIFTEMLLHIPPAQTQRELNRQSSIGWTPLLIACNQGHMNLVNNMLMNHARVDVFDIEGRSALHLAAEHGYIEVCDALLTNKAFINSKSRVGRTALHYAAANGFKDLVKFLIRDHNAVIDILTLRKQTPLHLASQSGQLETCMYSIRINLLSAAFN